MKSINRRVFLKQSATAALTLSSGPYISKNLPDVLVIGAGATGCCASWHLNKLGQKVMVVESSPAPCLQASQGAAGFVANWSGLHVPKWHINERRMQEYGIRFYTEFAERCNTDIGFKKCGICYVFTKANEWNKALKIIETSDDLNIPFEVLDHESANKLLPLMRIENVAGIVNDPTSIRIRAADTIPALAAEAKNNGVRFTFNNEVNALVTKSDKIIGVKTKTNTYQAGQVLISAGAWSIKLLKQLNYQFPIKPLIETRYTTQSFNEIPTNLPLLIFSDIGFYIREELGGFLIGGGDSSRHTDRQVSIENPPSSDVLKHHGQINRIQKHLKSIYHIMPILSKTSVKEVRGGVPTFTDDSLFVADRLPDFVNAYVITACQEAGITHGPALGQMMAEFISTGSRGQGLSRFSFQRF